MKIAILADFKDNSKLTKLAKATLNHTGPLTMEGHDYSNYKNQTNADVVLQFLSPENFTKIPNCKTVGILLEAKQNPAYLSLVDELWYDYPQICPSVNYQSIGGLDIHQLDGEFIFYTINQDYNKSHTDALIRAFNLEFDPAEPANLLIKTNRVIDKEIVEIKSKLNLYNSFDIYKKHVVINNNSNEGQILSIHKACDCFVITDNYYDSVEAKTFGNYTIVANDSISIDELRKELRYAYMNRKNSFLFKNNYDVVTYLLSRLIKQ